MPKPAWEDLTAFLDIQDFAVTATITPFGGGATRQVNGIFDAPYELAMLGRETERDASRPTFTCRAEDVLGVHRKDAITIPGEGTFGIMTDPQGDGTGLAVLELLLE